MDNRLGPFELNSIVEGDNIEGMRQIPNDSVQLVVTSPPYFDAKPEYATYGSYAQYLAQIQQWLAEIFRVLEPGRRCIWNINDLLQKKEFREQALTPSADSVQIAKKVGFLIRGPIIWDDPLKGEGWLPGTYPNGPSVVLNYSIDYLWVLQKPDTWQSHHPRYKPYPPELARYDIMDKEFLTRFGKSQVWEVRGDNHERIGHPAPFPEALIEPCIRMWSRPCDIVMDPFSGSGTVAVSALKWRRHFLGFERHPVYYHNSLKRIERRKAEILHEQLAMPGLVLPTLTKRKPKQLRLYKADS